MDGLPVSPSWWERLRAPSVWGRSVEELTLDFPAPGANGLLRPDTFIRHLRIRPAWGSDHQKLEAVRRQNRLWLSPWEATLPPGSNELLPTAGEYRRRVERQMHDGESLVMVIEADGEVAGLVSISGVQRGAMSQGNLGYWIGQQWARQGVTSLAVAAVVDLVIGELGLHRLEINVRPENAASLGVARRLGLRHEGLRVRYMCIAGAWADHEGFAVDAEMLSEGGLVERRIVGRYQS